LDHRGSHGGYRVHSYRGGDSHHSTEAGGGGLAMEVINYELLRYPINWITVLLMVLIAAIAFHFVLKWGGTP
jgi:hypothetical protein